MGIKKTRAKSKGKKKRAFVFTLDALLVLPLIIMIISSLISFSSTLKENVLLHEYTYIVAKDSVNYLSELEVGQISVAGLNTTGYSSLTVLEFVITKLSDTNARRLAVEGTLNPTVPYFSAYIFEYNDNGHWIEIARGGNLDKLSKYSFQVSAVKVVSGLSEPYITFNGQIVSGLGQDYLSGYPCASGITCQLPSSLYTKGEMMGPMMFRIRVFS